MNQNSLGSDTVSESSECIDQEACEIEAGVSETVHGIAPFRVRIAVRALLTPHEENEYAQAVSGEGLA